MAKTITAPDIMFLQGSTYREKLNAVRLAYGILWHCKTDDKKVHDSRKILLGWLNDKDQQKIGIEEAKAYLKEGRHEPN